jgi:maltose O-acetyltransferase
VSISLFLYNTFASLLPETRFYPFKTGLLRLCGFSIDRSARIVSSARYFGSFALSVGEDTFIGHDVLIAGGNCKISIGNACDLSPRATMIAGSHEIDMHGAHTAGSGYSKDIIVEDGVWIGAGAIVLGGVRIGKKSVIAAGSVVTRDIPPFSIAAGVPCKVIKTWKTGEQCWITAGEVKHDDDI